MCQFRAESLFKLGYRDVTITKDSEYTSISATLWGNMCGMYVKNTLNSQSILDKFKRYLYYGKF